MKKPRLTDFEYSELRRKRDESIRAIAKAVAEKLGAKDPEKVTFHAHGISGCYCACPDGPCEHLWDGPEYSTDNCSSSTCSKCGQVAMFHDMRCGP